MKILGWIRQGDKTACGGTVVEGIQVHLRNGLPISFQGAMISCKRKNCVIAEGRPTIRLENGKQMCHHGHTSSAGCPIYSTLNDVDGWGNSGGEDVPVRFVQDDQGDWVGKMNEGYDQHFLLTDEETGEPLANRFYRMTCNGKVIEGKTDGAGKTEKVTSDDPAEVTIEIMPEGYTRAGT